ncbi:Mg2+ and Co2+ transporter CorA [Alkalibacillus flavidus]|uniref:Mg2+ and Co2+ transporter CorA n=1 Tax=Alkalibacillus flavidus TaxID=546021 RepID=A0ABV2KR12_9BACI
MSSHPLTPKVERFKQFVERHPDLIDLVREGTYTWQKLYSLWKEHGETSDVWNKLTDKQKSSTNYSDHIQSLLQKLADLDVERVEHQVNQMMKTLGQVEQLTKEFQRLKQQKRPKRFPW